MQPTLTDLHQKYQQHLESQGKAHATVIAYTKDIEQLVDFLSKQGKVQPEDVTAEDIDAFKELLKKERYTGKSISQKNKFD